MAVRCFSTSPSSLSSSSSNSGFSPKQLCTEELYHAFILHENEVREGEGDWHDFPWHSVMTNLSAFSWPCFWRFALLAPAEYTADIKAAIARGFHKAQMHIALRDVANNDICYNDKHPVRIALENNLHKVKCADGVLYCKSIETLSRFERCICENERNFSLVSNALALSNISSAFVPFTDVFRVDSLSTVVTSSLIGSSLADQPIPLAEVVVQGFMGIWAMQKVGHILHLDIHLGNIVAAPFRPYNRMYATDYETGLEKPISDTQETIRGLCLYNSGWEVNIIDGGLSSTMEEGRRTYHKHFPDRKQDIGWENIKTVEDLMKNSTFVQRRKKRMLPIAHFDDIPDNYVDIFALLICCYGAKVDDTSPMYGILQTAIECAHEDPEFGTASFVKICEKIAQSFSRVDISSHVRTREFYVVALADPHQTRSAIFEPLCEVLANE